METHGRRKAAVVVLAALLAGWVVLALVERVGDALDVLDPGDGFGVVDAVIADVELLEERLVDEAAPFLGCLSVAHLRVVE
jgi:hypothetical protein